MSDAIINEPDRVVLVGEWGSEIIYDVTYSGTENLSEFLSEFEIVKGDFMADPDEDFYQGVLFMSLIRRLSDGKLFGFPVWKMVAKYNDADEAQPNGEEHGFESEWDENDEYVKGPYWVWRPVKPFTITGYEFQ